VGSAGVYPSKKGTLVKHIRYGLCYIGGNLKERFSMHSLKDGKRSTQNAKREDFKIKDILEGPIPPQINSGVSLGDF